MSASRRDYGFSLVELMVVIVILGILAAIAIPVLTSQREKAARAAMVSDLRGVRTAQEARSVDGDPKYTEDVALLGAHGYRRSSGVSAPHIDVTADDDAYIACVSHSGVDEWLVFASVSGTTGWSPTDCLS